jgi:acetylornithine/succinyldiaminopimelate/putrescine aminotransferase
MGRGSSKAGSGGGGGNALATQAAQNVQGVTGYHVKRSDGVDLDFFFQTQDGDTYVSNSLGEIPQPTPNGWTETEMVNTIRQFGGQVTTYSKQQLVNMETQRLQDRQATNSLLNQSYVRNSGADAVNRGYRNTRRAQRSARRIS